MGATRYETVLAALSAGVVIHAPDTAIIEANERAKELLGIHDLHGRLATDPAWDFFDEDMSPLPIDQFPVVRVLATGEPVTDQIVVVRPPLAPDVIVEVSALPRFDDHSELLEVVVTFIVVTARESRRIDAERLNVRLSAIAVTDDLTGLANRRGIVQLAEQAVSAARRNDTSLAFLVIDLDHFKRVNDRFGHAGGDALLLTIAGQISESLRREDSVGRFGGEEFLAVLPGADLAAAEGVAERVRADVELAGEQMAVTASIGVAVYDDEESAYSLINRADAAMYRAKEAGRNRVCT
jgi:diguanylate cyclase (GGDEF)-like protein